MNDTTALWVALAIVALCDLGVSIEVVRSGYYNNRQVFAQLVIVWVLPILGAALVALVLWAQRAGSTARNAGANADDWQNAETFSQRSAVPED